MTTGKIGLTGGIGSGKSTVASLFKQLNIETIDADHIARQITQPGTAVFDYVVEAFGRNIIDSKGSIDRNTLGKIIFNNIEKRKHLESILHPPIKKIMFEQCLESESPYCILEIPLLIESGQNKEMDRVLVVTCQSEIIIKHLQQNRGMCVAEIERICRAQISDQQRLRKANDVIVNNSDIKSLEKQVKKLHKDYLTQFTT